MVGKPASSIYYAFVMTSETKMHIRCAQLSDLPELVEIYNFEVLNGTATFDTQPVTIESRRAWFDAHNKENHPLWVAEIDGHVAGYVTLSTFNAKAAYSSSVELSVYVSQNYRRMGLGLTLAQAIIDWAKANPATHRIYSLVTSENTASKRLHEKLGFRFVGTITQAGRKFDRYLDVDFWELAV